MPNLATPGPQPGGGYINPGPDDYAGGTVLAQASPGIVLAASNNAFGTADVIVSNPSTVQLSNAGGIEYRDSAAKETPVSGPGPINPVLSGLHSTQAYENTRFAYTGKIRNPTATPILVTFAEQYDDDVYLTVDVAENGPVLNDTAWNQVSTGQISLTPGEHDIFIAVRNGGGGAGPNNGENNAFPGWSVQGVAYSFTQPEGGASTLPGDYTKLGAFDNTRFTYTGTINNTSGGPLVYTFVKQYDDAGFVEIDGNPIITDGTFNAVVPGQVTLNPGEHTIRISVFNGGGGAGPNSGWNKGIGISTTQPLGTPSTNNADYRDPRAKVAGAAPELMEFSGGVFNGLRMRSTMSSGCLAITYDTSRKGWVSGPWA